MGNIVFNIALGKVAEYGARVQGNDPANSAVIEVVIDNGTQTDNQLRDLDTLSAITATDAAEVTNTNYARGTVTTVTVTTDDTANQVEVDIADRTWSAVAAGDTWDDLVICYDSDTTAGTDANIVPMTLHDFSVTPDGSDITAQYNADGFFTASSTA